MATTYLNVPAGTVSNVIDVGPLVSVCAGPSVLGGTVLVEYSIDGRLTWVPWQYGTISQAGSIRLNSNGHLRVTAATAAANVFISDMTLANTPNVTQLVVVTNTLASASATTEQVLFSVRVPSNYLTPIFRMEAYGHVSLTNSVNVKTLIVKAGGVAGTALYTSPSLASQLNHNFVSVIAGRGDGQSLQGFGPGASGGIGNSTTAYPTLTRDYINQETEFVVTATKATAAETMQLESLIIKLF